ncbi:tRNA (adenosine(37)-N6)-threonylcarbamoyltransferase complex dimerization subunit type 1 TsaB [Paraoerskovia marina]|uniref:tRNA (adenosine(37)-N6)-threonylcarbamoyltransferase complex dimerization subunit type 1 TsaB n=1 Tax=Paraoerskovia marina TaxID=545619 RepID=UPI0004927671|nr:tRNA (adenosine(37)-N6)-threonylcarbamoyltransferase complex dimerization subunit type 1 TsaB [Paraoerskovia marina]
MAVLSIDTSAAVAAAVVREDGARLASAVVPEQRRHAELLAPMVADLLLEASITPADLTAVVGGTGPAPFTGLRVGLVTARTTALALGIPVLGVPSLDAVAVQAVADLGLLPDAEVLVATDARRRQVYWARYSVLSTAATYGVPDLRRTDGFDVAAAADLRTDGATVVGQGAALYPDALLAPEDAPQTPDPVLLARIALARRAAGVEQPTEPLYLRRPDVQVPAPRKRAVPVENA